ALDPIIRNKAREDLAAIQKRFGTTIILVTHDMDEAISLGDTIAVMDKGRLLQYGTPADILLNPATTFVGELVGMNDRAFRLLSLINVAAVVEPGEAAGPPVAETASLREAFGEMLWSNRTALPVVSSDN